MFYLTKHKSASIGLLSKMFEHRFYQKLMSAASPHQDRPTTPFLHVSWCCGHMQKAYFVILVKAMMSYGHCCSDLLAIGYWDNIQPELGHGSWIGINQWLPFGERRLPTHLCPAGTPLSLNGIAWGELKWDKHDLTSPFPIGQACSSRCDLANVVISVCGKTVVCCQDLTMKSVAERLSFSPECLWVYRLSFKKRRIGWVFLSSLS